MLFAKFCRGHRFINILKKPKAIVQGFFLGGPKKSAEKSNPPESKRKEKLNDTCFSCIAHLSRELSAFKVSYPLYI